jgi:vancomycin resistance protein YoaR
VLAVVAVLVLLGAAYAVAYAYAGDRVPRGSSVEGVAIGGLTVPEAQARLREQLVARHDAPLRLTADGETARLVPSRSGLTVDVAATVARAGGGSANPVGLARAIFGSASVEPVLAVDEAALSSAIRPLAADVRRRAADGAVAFDGSRVKVRQPVVGRSLDVPTAAAAVAQSWRAGESTVTLEVAKFAPKVGTAELRRAVEQVARPAVSGPVRLVSGGLRATLGPAELGSALSMRAGPGGRLSLVVSAERLQAAAAGAMADLRIAPRDADIRLDGGRPVVVPAREGRTVSLQTLVAKLPAALAAKGDARRVVLPPRVEKPDLTTAEAAALGVKEVVGGFSTNFPYAAYRNTNLGRAAELINGTLLEPGETFSLNDVVGERTRANGFTSGYVINGGRLREELGGGVSQVATTTFNAMWFAGLENVEHHPHRFYIDRYPMGREATVWWGGLDLRFRNDTRYGVLVQAYIDRSAPGQPGTMTVRMWSTKHRTVTTWTGEPSNYRPISTIYDDKEGCVDQGGVAGFDVSYGRTITEPGKPPRRESYTQAYASEDRIYCRAAPG